MTILAIRTDKPEAELYIFDVEAPISHRPKATIKWEAHRQLAETIHKRIDEILNKSSILLSNIEGIVCFKGPGSFTGLRIGLSVANGLAYALGVPVMARGGDDWLRHGINDLTAGKNDKIAAPEYGTPPKTTRPKK
jgi:tRNA threonylcarbamoyladenosine biosynthesis protein TsaB